LEAIPGVLSRTQGGVPATVAASWRNVKYAQPLPCGTIITWGVIHLTKASFLSQGKVAAVESAAMIMGGGFI